MPSPPLYGRKRAAATAPQSTPSSSSNSGFHLQPRFSLPRSCSLLPLTLTIALTATLSTATYLSAKDFTPNRHFQHLVRHRHGPGRPRFFSHYPPVLSAPPPSSRSVPRPQMTPCSSRKLAPLADWGGININNAMMVPNHFTVNSKPSPPPSTRGYATVGTEESSKNVNIDVDMLLEEGKKTIRSNPQASLSAFQKVIQLSGDVVSIEQRQAAFWNSACVFLRFGELARAQQSLANAARLGLDLQKAKNDPNLLPLQGSTAKMEEELWRYAKDLTSKGPEEVKLRPELESVNSELELAEGQDLRYSSIARRVGILTIGTLALTVGLGALLFPGLKSPEPAADYYELEE